MARLTTKQRASLPSSDFALSGGRFPMPDKAHAVAAERLVGRSEKAGNITPAEASTVRSKAAVKLGTTMHKPGCVGCVGGKDCNC